jgi:hypothetical protein
MGEQRYKVGGYHTLWKGVFWLLPHSISWTPMLIYINNKLSSLLLCLMLLLKVDKAHKGGDGEQTYTYICLWDTLVVNYMIIVLYSYIRPVFAKKIKRNQPETVE